MIVNNIRKFVFIKNRVSHLSIPVFVVSVLILMCLTSLLFCSIAGSPNQHDKIDQSFIGDGIMAVLIFPPVETFFFQLMPIEISTYIFRKCYHRRLYQLSVLISAGVFAMIHCYSLRYMVYTFILGIILATAYILVSGISIKKPFISIWLIHFVWNLMGFLFKLFEL